MSALDRLLVSAAVAASPLAHRDDRREQWLADVRDAHELDLSPTALAFGALTTALFHRRAGHRSTWGNTVTTMPGSVRRTPHTIPTIPVLLAFAATAFLAASTVLGLLQRYNGIRGAMPVILLDSILGTVVPGLAVAACVLLTAGTALRRRATGAIAVLAVAAVWWSLDTGYWNPPVHAALSTGLIASGWLAVWLVVLRRPGWTWSLLLLPVVASVLVFPLGMSLFDTTFPASFQAAVAQSLDIVPFLVAVLAAVVAGHLSTDASVRFVEREGALVDKSA